MRVFGSLLAWWLWGGFGFACGWVTCVLLIVWPTRDRLHNTEQTNRVLTVELAEARELLDEEVTP